MLNRRRNAEQLRRTEERRQREQEAGKLTDEIPGLVSLRLEIDEMQDDVAVSAARHTRHVVVERAPALFEIPCTDLDEDGFAIEGGTCGAVDCDDADPQVNPHMTEVHGNGIDDDCDGTIDETCFIQSLN